MFDIGWQELLLLLIIMLLLFGAKKLPELSRGIGESLREFRKGLEDKDDKKADTTEKKQA